MAFPSKTEQRRKDFTPLIAAAFIELGYRGTTSAQLAQRCGVRENVLYRVWPTKKAMFLDAVGHVYAATMAAWDRVAADRALGRTVAERILSNQADYHGRMRLYRIVFAGLTEDDPDIKSALRDVYRRFHQFIAARIGEHRAGDGEPRRRKGESAPRPNLSTAPEPAVAAWALIGLGAVIDMQRELE